MKIAKIGAISLLMSTMAACTFSLSAQTSKGLLWKISGNGLVKSSYLFGTIHMLCPDDLHITPPIQAALDEADQLVTELDFDDPNLMAEMQKYMTLPAETSPDALYSETESAIVDSFLTKRIGMGLDKVGQIKPFFLSSMLIPTMLECQPASWELQLATIAKETEREMLGLETVEEQIAVVDGMGYDAQADMLVRTVEDYDRMQSMMKRMVEAYVAEDIELLFSGAEEYMGAEYAAFEQDFLTTRNKNWVPRFRKLAKEKPTFFAVGAGHLAGENGMVALLQKAGFTLTPIPVNSGQ